MNKIKNIFSSFILIIFSTLLALAFIEYVIGNNWLKNHHKVPDINTYQFYNKYYKELHHLRPFESWNYKNGLMFTYLEPEDAKNNNSKVLINGDSWAENLINLGLGNGWNKIVVDELIKIKRKKDLSIIVSGTTSYSFSPTTVQLKILRRDFNIYPERIITIIDHTDVGDEICRYKDKLDINEDGTLNKVNPEELYSSEVYNVGIYLTKVGIYLSDDFNIIKYIKNKIFRRELKIKKTTIRAPRCTFPKIMSPVINGLTEDDKNHLETVVFRYIEEVFSDKNVKKLVLVTHPHMKHFTGEYKFYFGDFLQDILSNHKYRNQITIMDFRKEFYDVYFDGDNSANYEDVFIIEDVASHINVKSRVPFTKRIFEKLFK